MISTRGQLPRIAAIRRCSQRTICRPVGRLAGRSTAAIMRPVAIEHHDRLKAVFIVMGVEQTQLLAAMHGVEGVVDVEHDAARHLAEALAIVIDHGTAHAQQGARVRQVLQARDGGLRAQIGIVRQAAHRQLEHRVAAQAVGVVAVLIARRDHQHADADNLVQIRASPAGDRADRGCRPPAVARWQAAARSRAAPAARHPTTCRRASKRATIVLPPTGDKPGQHRGKFNFDGHALPGSDGSGFNTNPTSYQRLPCPSPLMNFPG